MQMGMDTAGGGLQLLWAPHSASDMQGQHKHCALLHPPIPRLSNLWLVFLFQDASPVSGSKGLIIKTKGW